MGIFPEHKFFVIVGVFKYFLPVYNLSFSSCNKIFTEGNILIVMKFDYTNLPSFIGSTWKDDSFSVADLVSCDFAKLSC